MPSQGAGQADGTNSSGEGNAVSHARYRPDSDINDSTLSQVARDVFERYSKIPSDQVIEHIRAIRATAFAVWPYPCIGELRFLEFSISLHPAYPSILELLKRPDETQQQPLLLDIGCCVGQDLRKLTFDGVPAQRLVGAELKSEFVELGYDLFRDRNSFKAQFVVGNALDDSSSEYVALSRRFDIIHAASFLHLFDWDDQLSLAVKMASLLKDRAGVMVIGRQVGSIEPGSYPGRVGVDQMFYRHDKASFQRMWDEVGSKTGTAWQVSATLEKRESWQALPHRQDVRVLTFQVLRVK